MMKKRINSHDIHRRNTIYNKNLTKKQIPDNIEKVIEQSEMVAYNIGYGSNK